MLQLRMRLTRPSDSSSYVFFTWPVIFADTLHYGQIFYLLFLAAFSRHALEGGYLPNISHDAKAGMAKLSCKFCPRLNHLNKRWSIILKIQQKVPQTLPLKDSSPLFILSTPFICFQGVKECGIIQASAIFKSQKLITSYNQQTIQKNFQKFQMRANKFIVKLLQMMREFPEIINWSPNGLEMDIYDIERFSVEVHPIYFTTSNYQSFQRQLNMYNFKKMSKRKNAVSFTHPDFRRGNQPRFQYIKRRQQIMQEKEPESIISRSRSDQGQNQTALPSATYLLSQELRSTLALIKKETTKKGTLLVERLQKILQKSTGSLASVTLRKPGESSMTQQFRQCVSFCRLEEVMMHRGELYGSEFNFQSGNFNHPLYFDE